MVRIKSTFVGAIHNGLTLASKDAEIKHLVIDLSINSGGSTDEMLFMIGMLTGSNALRERNNLSKRIVTHYQNH